jgi:amino acid permease
MSHARSQGVRTFCLIFGVVEALGAALWCYAGAGIYGSPFSYLSGAEAARVWAFLLTGPFSALPASVVVLWRPRWGGAFLIAGGLGSGALAVPFIRTGAGIVPLAIASFPMFAVGLSLLLASARAAGLASGTGQSVEPGGQQCSRGGMGSILIRVVLFLVALIGTCALFGVLAGNNVTGLRGAPRSDNPFFYENQDVADGVVFLLVATLIGLITFVRKRLRLRAEAVAGMWMAVLLVGLIILVF